jgi:hypothetical protein
VLQLVERCSYLKPAMSDALIEGVSGAIGAITALVSTYPLLTVSVQHADHSKQLHVLPTGVYAQQCCSACVERGRHFVSLCSSAMSP